MWRIPLYGADPPVSHVNQTVCSPTHTCDVFLLACFYYDSTACTHNNLSQKHMCMYAYPRSLWYRENGEGKGAPTRGGSPQSPYSTTLLDVMITYIWASLTRNTTARHISEQARTQGAHCSPTPLIVVCLRRLNPGSYDLRCSFPPGGRSVVDSTAGWGRDRPNSDHRQHHRWESKGWAQL